jgi:hypothetical protein
MVDEIVLQQKAIDKSHHCPSDGDHDCQRDSGEKEYGDFYLYLPHFPLFHLFHKEG